MKNVSNSVSSFFPMSGRTIRLLLGAAILLISANLQLADAQAKISIQGILKRANGSAIEDERHNLTFTLYESPSGGPAAWSETQEVETSSGIYSAILGDTTALNIPFDKVYYLSVSKGTSLLTPRIELTAAPYALSLIGEHNKFPSTGKVIADSMQLHGGMLAGSGAPGANGSNHKGYAFTDEKDSGLFSPAADKVSLYVTNVEIIEATPTGVEINGNANVSGTFTTGNVNLSSGGKINYNGTGDWRLVAIDDLTGWGKYTAADPAQMAWNSSTNSGAPDLKGSASHFRGQYIAPTDNNQVLKKLYNLSTAGNFSQIKVRFKYHFIDTWCCDNDDRGWAAFADNVAGGDIHVGWTANPSTLDETLDFNAPGFIAANNYDGLDNAHSDHAMTGEMMGYKNGSNTSFWLFFGAALTEDTANERYGVGMIEIWVR